MMTDTVEYLRAFWPFVVAVVAFSGWMARQIWSIVTGVNGLYARLDAHGEKIAEARQIADRLDTSVTLLSARVQGHGERLASIEGGMRNRPTSEG